MLCCFAARVSFVLRMARLFSVHCVLKHGTRYIAGRWLKTFMALIKVQFVGTINPPCCWAEPYITFRKEMLDLHKD